MPAPTATVEPTPTLTPTAEPTPTPTPTATPTLTPTPDLTPTPTPTATPTAKPKPTPAPKPTPPASQCPEPSTTVDVEPLVTSAPGPATESPAGRWQPAIQEIETDHEALGRVYFERDNVMELELCHAFGLFFLDVETGSVEGWTWDAPILPSPGNRFVYFSSDVTPVLYDRMTERSYTWDPAELSLVVETTDVRRSWPTYTNALLGWGAGSAERLLFRGGTHYAVVDASMAAVAWFELDEGADPRRWWA